MEKRFTVRELALYAFMAIVLLSIWLAMFQIDRQWQFLAQTQDKLDSQTRDISAMKRQLRQGQVVGQSAVSGPGELPENWRGFARAHGVAQRGDYTEGDWLIYSFSSALPTLTPFLSGDAYASRIFRWTLDTLCTRDPVTLEWLPLVAESWEVSDDGLKLSFKVRSGVRFADGEPLTAQDIVFTHRFIMDERIAAPRQRAYYSRMRKVEADGDTVTFYMNEPYFMSFQMAAQMPILAKHYYEKYLTDVDAAEQYNSSTNLLFGSGPYKLENPQSWSPGDNIELVRNERYWGWQPASFSKRIWKTIQSDTAQLTEFKNGGIDVYAARPLEYRDLIRDERVGSLSEGYQYYSPVAGYTYIAWNQLKDKQPTFFADKRVRQAMTYLTDKQRIIDELFLGQAQPMNGPFNPDGKQANPNIGHRSVDIAKAKSLLTDAGFVDRNGDGVLEDKRGKEFRFELTYPSNSDTYKSIVLLLKDLYVRAGIIMEPNPVDWPILIEALNTKDFDAISLAWTGQLEIDVYQNMHSSQTEPGGDNFINHRSPKLDSLIEAARGEIDETKRMAIWHQVHELLWDEQPYTYLLRGKTLAFVSRRIRNVQTVRAGINQGGLWRMPMEWYVPAGEQMYSN